MIVKRMLRPISVMLFCTLCWSGVLGRLVYHPGPHRVTEVDFRVKGVSLGSSYALVLRQLGRPLSSKRDKIVDEYEVCGPSYTSLELRYEGAVIELIGDLRWRNFKVVSMEVTSPQLLIAPGVKIGMTEKEIRSKLGVPWQERNESGFHILDYVTKGNDGGASVHFVAGHLVKVDWEYTRC
jgi:hypothetical protein